MSAEPLRGATIAVTGATGFVGSRVVRALRSRGTNVRAFGRKPGRLGRDEFTSWDIAAGPLPAAGFADVVVHCAGLVTDWGKRSDFARCHVDGTRHVLASFGEPCGVVHVSTASVYDALRGERPLREDAPPARRFLNAYSETKAQAERLVAARTRHIMLRPHAIYGPGDRVLLPRLLAANVMGRQLAVGDGRNPISLTHVDNLVDAVVLASAALLHGAPSGTFNVADETPETLDDVLRAVLEGMARATRIVHLPFGPAYALGAMLEWVYGALGSMDGPLLTRYRVVQVAKEFTLDLTRAKTLLGYRPTRSVRRFIAEGGLHAA